MSESLIPYPCPLCSERFYYLADKKSHVKDKHPSSKKGQKGQEEQK